MVIMNKKKEIFKRLKSILFVSLFLVFSTVFVFMPNNTEMVGALSFLTRVNSISVSAISEELSLSYNFPISDEIGPKTDAYHFEVENMLNAKNKYNIVFQTGALDDPTKLDNCAVKYMLYKDDVLIKDVTTLSDDGIILTDEIDSNSVVKYSLKFWISDDAECKLFGKTFAAGISVDVVK